MYAIEPWRSLDWRHPTWDLVRYYCSLRGKRVRESWLTDLRSTLRMTVGGKEGLPVPEEDVDLFSKYLTFREKQLKYAFDLLRSEEEALAYCTANGIEVRHTATRSKDHHQSSKALIAAVSEVAERLAREHGTTVEPDPQTRCVWCNRHNLHVTARNLDGAIPGLANPAVIWEIKEYWGKTSGGSKMSDAVYECNLVGRELREFEERSNVQVAHVVFVDGREQWSHRMSDLARFLDLLYQGLIDFLFVGREVETEWMEALSKLLSSEA